jgi:23S rRNA (pseudouridine1915-N3)-methyltransferase
MNWRIITVGKPVFPWAKAAVETYLKRLQHYTKVEHVIIKDGPRTVTEPQLLTSSENSLRVVLDERGEAHRSLDLARWIGQKHLDGTKRVSLLIGGSDGHSAELRTKADAVWKLSELTLQHDVALVVLLEQLYRCHTILKGEPYHRE